jgi:hypothetical protein
MHQSGRLSSPGAVAVVNRLLRKGRAGLWWLTFSALVVGLAPLAVASAFAAPGWKIQPTPNPSPPLRSPQNFPALDGVSCTSTKACWAVGSSGFSRATGSTLAEFWNGSNWTIQSTPNPTAKKEKYAELKSVSCTSTNSCIAVGDYNTRAGIAFPLAEFWNGSNWTIKPTATPSLRDGELTSVSCSSARACMAVGDLGNGFGGFEGPVAQFWNGRSWTITHPSRSGTPLAVSCASARVCIAVGENHCAAACEEPLLAELWNGNTWTAWPLSDSRAARSSAELSGVSCASTNTCVAVGWYSNRSGAVPLAGSWNGKKWIIQSVPKPSGGKPAELSKVSCASPKACVAVGEYFSGGEQLPLAGFWNGHTWTVQPLPKPPGATDVTLGGPEQPFQFAAGGVSCTSAKACMAVGQSFRNPNGNTSATLAEQYQK